MIRERFIFAVFGSQKRRVFDSISLPKRSYKKIFQNIQYKKTSLMSEEKYKVKLIKLSDEFEDNSRKFPFIHTTKSNVRFRLRSKLTYDHEPVLLIEKLNSFDYILPMRKSFNLSSKACQENFFCLRGKIDIDGAWYTQLQDKVPGVVSFQLAFVPLGTTMATRYGTCDVVFLTQQGLELRKLRKQSVFPRCIGNYREWENYFLRQMELGYNAFHLAPIQETGSSKSYYSLKSHLQLSSDIFQGSQEQKIQQLQGILDGLRKKGVIFFVDIVLNHCSFDAEWIRENPDAVYTPENTPKLLPAFQVDEIIYRWGNQIKSLLTAQFGGEPVQFNEDFLQEIQLNLKNALDKLNLEEYFTLSQDVEKMLSDSVPPRKSSHDLNLFAPDPIDIIEKYIDENICKQCQQKNQVTISSLEAWKALNLEYEMEDLRMAIRNFNLKWSRKVKQEWLPQIVINTMNEVRHNYVLNEYREFGDPYPFVSKYFSKISIPKSKNLNDSDHFYALNNGWVAGADSSENFALSQQYYYLRRRVHVWGDLIRIRYGDKPKDSPHAWDYMKKYVQEMAKLFDGFRLDNCHGTQLNVARYMVKQARLTNPNIIIFAELFTDTDQEKALFVRSIGINSTLKEAQHMLSGPSFTHNIYDSLGKGARFVGGLNRYMEERDQIIKYSTRKKPILLVYDLTHDNQTYYQKHLQVLQTPITVTISLMGAFIGSTKGYDQFYADKILVTEMEKLYARDSKLPFQTDKSELRAVKFTFPFDGVQRLSLFGSWNEWKSGYEMKVCNQSKIYWVELELPPGHYEYKFCETQRQEWKTHPHKSVNRSNNHQLHLNGGQNSYKYIYSNLEPLRVNMAQLSDKYFELSEYFCYHHNDVVVIVREGQNHEKSICVVANMSQSPQKLNSNIQLPGVIKQATVWRQSEFSMYEGHVFISDIIKTNNLYEYFDIAFDATHGKDLLYSNEIPVGFACVIQCQKTKEQIDAIQQVRTLVSRPIKLPDLDVLDCNLIMYGSNREEQTAYGSSNYVIPQDGNKQLVYGGFASVFVRIKNAKKANDLSQKLFDNLREGNWIMDYYLGRLKRYPHLSQVTDRVEKVFNALKALPRYLIPRYFSDYVYRFCHAVEEKMSNKSSSIFERKIKTAVAQFISKFPNQRPGFQVTVAAGLPHFATGWARCWGRDTFTCNQMLILHPKVYKQVILQFASALRHGMIPNLLDGGNNPRYNCRDACWWFIRGVKEYAIKTRDYDIFKQKVNMLFLSNDLLEHNELKKKGASKTMTVEQVLHQIIQSHAHGIFYRQWRAGYQIDSNMFTEGFNVHLKVDDNTGFIDGGNQLNCLTWMDKMGSSYKAGNKGYPATPRAGIPVELVGLLKNCLSSLSKLHEQGYYSFNEVLFKKRKIKYSGWAEKIKQNFEKEFFIPEDNQEKPYDMMRQSQSYEESQQIEKPEETSSYISSSHIRLRGIYKDVLKAKIINEQFRLRPNALITLAVAPEIVNPDHARQYLQNVQDYLLFPKSIGVSTLAQIHESLYMPYYDNSDDSANIKTAHGFSYHNGPEWVWLYGFYIAAKANFESGTLKKQQLLGLLQEHNNYINNDEWCSLPQMTNKNGEFNRDSCPAQAWSISGMLLAWEAIQNMK